jgi:hypothetical protein
MSASFDTLFGLHGVDVDSYLLYMRSTVNGVEMIIQEGKKKDATSGSLMY